MRIRKSLTITAAIVAFAAVNAFTQTAVPGPITFTEKDRESAISYMNETKADYIKELTGISESQLNFRAGEGRWTMAEIAEHITVVEEALFSEMVNGRMKPVAAKCDNPFRVADGMVLGSVTNRTRKAQAPEVVQPNGRWKTVPALLASFEKARGITIDYMKTNKSDLRNVFGASPLGTVDGFQQMMFMIGHSERHLAQLKEVKADAKYPKK